MLSETIMNEFIAKLIYKTKLGELKWERPQKAVTEQEEFAKGISSVETELLNEVFFEHEWRHIDYKRTWYSLYNKDIIALVFETNESGMDGSIESGYNLYLLKELNKPIILPCVQSDLYRLENSISQTESEIPIIEDFINNFLLNQ